MEITHVLYFVLTLIITAYLFNKWVDKDYYIMSISLTPKYIEQLVNIYIKTKVEPELLIPENELKAEELDFHREQCIKFVLKEIDKVPFSNIIKKAYSKEHIVYLVDTYISSYLINLT